MVSLVSELCPVGRQRQKSVGTQQCYKRPRCWGLRSVSQRPRRLGAPLRVTDSKEAGGIARGHRGPGGWGHRSVLQMPRVLGTPLRVTDAQMPEVPLSIRDAGKLEIMLRVAGSRIFGWRDPTPS